MSVLIKLLFAKQKLFLSVEDLQTTCCYAARLQRTDPLNHAHVESSASVAREGIIVDAPHGVKFKLEYGG